MEFGTDNRIMNYIFTTEQENILAKFTVRLSEYWFMYEDIKIGKGHRNTKIEGKVASAKPLKEVDYEYIGLFYNKIKELYIFINMNINSAGITSWRGYWK